MTLEFDIERAQHAKRLLNDPLIQEAFGSLSVALHTAWETSPIRDREGQHEIKLMLKLLSDLKGYFDLALSDGELAAQTLKAREESKKGYSPAQWKREYYGY